jgi:hypothetical protein
MITYLARSICLDLAYLLLVHVNFDLAKVLLDAKKKRLLFKVGIFWVVNIEASIKYNIVGSVTQSISQSATYGPRRYMFCFHVKAMCKDPKLS